MPRDGTQTRNRILDATLDLVLEHGMAATSLDQVIARAGLTKGAFFYHFKGKEELALEVVKRFAAQDEAMLRELQQRAEALSRDPLQQVLLMVGLLAELFSGPGSAHPGCLFASFCYEGDLWDDRFRAIYQRAFHLWRDAIASRLRLAAKQRPPRIDVDIDTVADMANTVIEGAYVMARSYADQRIIRDHVLQYRNYLELLFAAAPQAGKARKTKRAQR